jgi:hypothetical protein
MSFFNFAGIFQNYRIIAAFMTDTQDEPYGKE